jgi:predicted transcriptional regulator
MNVNTRIAPSALGAMRFPPTTDEQFDKPLIKVSIADGSVLENRLSISHEQESDTMLKMPDKRQIVDVNKMLELKGKGTSNADIAKAFGVTPSAIRQRLKKLESNIKSVNNKAKKAAPEPVPEEETVDGFPEVEQAEEPENQAESPLERLNRDMAELHRQFKHFADIMDVFNVIRDSFGADTANRCLELIRPILDGEAK